jgi:hypothetical protein
MCAYKQFSKYDRNTIEGALDDGLSFRKIGDMTGRAASSIMGEHTRADGHICRAAMVRFGITLILQPGSFVTSGNRIRPAGAISTVPDMR